jgi:DNA-binding transcriptional LysR family regulator
MDLNRVAAFVRVVHDGSFTAAARSLGLPKSSVSRSVAHLEQDLGVRLLHRTTRQIRLTDAGTAFYARASRALAELDQATAVAADMSADLRGTVRVTAPVDFASAVLASVVARFVRRHPTIRVEMILTTRMVDLVAEGVDLAIRMGPLRDSSLVARRVGPLASALFATPKYLERRPAPSSIEELAAHDCVVFRPTGALWTLAHRDGSTKTVEVSASIGADDLEFVYKAVLSSAGVGLLPEFLCARDVEKGRLVRLLPGWERSGAVVSIVYPSATFVPRRVVVVREYLVRELTKFQRECEVLGRVE